MTNATTDPDPITIANATITDALVDWNLGCASPPELVPIVNEQVDVHEAIQPVGTNDIEQYDEDDTYWLAHGEGVYARYKNGPVGVPADTSPVTSTVELETVDGTVVERVPGLSHTTNDAVNDVTDHGSMSVTCKVGTFRPHTVVMDVDLAATIVERYVNGPLNSSDVSKVFHEREGPGRPRWDSLTLWPDREDWQALNDVEVLLCEDDDDIREWIVRPATDTEYVRAPHDHERTTGGQTLEKYND